MYSKVKPTPKKPSGQNSSRFYSARGASLFLDWGISVLGISILGWNKYLVTIAAQVIILLVNYAFSKLFVFKNRENPTDAAESK